MQTYAAVFAIGLLLAILLTPIVIVLGKRWGIVDVPGKRRVHRGAIPRIGGIAIAMGGLLGVAPVFLLQNTIGQAFWEAWEPLHALILASIGVFFLGLVDDLKGLPAWGKFLAETGLALYLVLAGVRIEHIELWPGHVIRFGWIGVPLTVLWIVGVTNAVNMIDGLDGLAAGVSGIALAVISGLALARDDTVMATLMLAHLGAVLGFLVYNFNPAKVFMGDCGSLYLGFFLGGASALTGHKTSTLVGFALPALALGIPLADTSFAVLRRLYRRRSLFSPDRGHIHHRLLAQGRTHRQAVLWIYGLAAGTTAIGSLLLVTREATTLLVLAGAILFLFLGLFVSIAGKGMLAGRGGRSLGAADLEAEAAEGNHSSSQLVIDLGDPTAGEVLQERLGRYLAAGASYVVVIQSMNQGERWIIEKAPPSRGTVRKTTSDEDSGACGGLPTA